MLNDLVADRDRLLWYLSSAAAKKETRTALTNQLDVHALRVGGPQSLSHGVTAQEYLIPAGAKFGIIHPEQPCEARFGERLRLVAFGVSAPELRYPQALEIALAWQAEAPPGADYTAFVHLVDAQGQRRTGTDVLLGGEEGHPTSQWEVGAQATTRHLIPLPADITPGEYQLVVGLYDMAGVRLLLPGGETAYPLATVKVR